MNITILTLFPEMFQGPLNESIIKKAQEKKLISIKLVNIRDFGIGAHQVVDDTSYGGGVGMVLRVDVVHRALKDSIDKSIPKENRRIVLTSAHGPTFNQKRANDLSLLSQLIIICGHYEGIDARIRDYCDEEISIGDFITTGGEIPAMLIADAVIRKVKGVLKDDATLNESFQPESDEGLEHPHYTKPPEYEGKKVPEILLSGHHTNISIWRKARSEEETRKNRPDLIKD